MYFLILLQTLLLEFKIGDFIFQDCDCGAICDAIEEVTVSKKGYRFSHVAIIVKDSLGQFVALESNIGGVKEVPLKDFLYRYVDTNEKPTVLIGRLKDEYQKLIPASVSFLKSKLNIPYDDAFLLENEAYYCSELLYDAFKFANEDKPLFSLFPMNFKTKINNQFHKEFEAYYQELGIPIPQGKLGLNPGSMSREKVFKFYKISSFGY
jgi:hypothetical protein